MELLILGIPLIIWLAATLGAIMSIRQIWSDTSGRRKKTVRFLIDLIVVFLVSIVGPLMFYDPILTWLGFEETVFPFGVFILALSFDKATQAIYKVDKDGIVKMLTNRKP